MYNVNCVTYDNCFKIEWISDKAVSLSTVINIVRFERAFAAKYKISTD